MPNPKVFLSISINNQPPKHLTIELYANTTPITAAKFHSLCTGQNISQLHYKNSTFHRILLRQNDQERKVTALCQGGTLPNASKEEIESVYGIETKAENFIKKHDGFGTVSMVSPRGPQFFILTDVSERNDGKYVVVGRVVDGLDVMREIAGVGSFTGEPLGSVVIVDCGLVRENFLSSNISVSQKMSGKEFERVISTSNKQLLNGLKKIMSVNKQFTEVDPEDIILENENEEELVEVVGKMEHNLNVLFHLKAEVCSLEKRQNQLLSQTRTQNSSLLKAASQAKLIEVSHHNTAEVNRRSFLSSEFESQDFSYLGSNTKKIQKKKKIKLTPAANPVTTAPQNPASQAGMICSNCEITETPLWRTGPLGPKTLCNACGLRYKSGGLSQVYRPLLSPTFNPAVHTNSRKKSANIMKKCMFQNVATTSIDAESEFILNESSVLWNI